MNLLFFLTPKCDVCVLNKNFTLRQAVEKLRQSRRSAVPVIDDEGYYCGTVSEGDLLRAVVDAESHEAWEHVGLADVVRADFNLPVKVMASIDDLLHLVTEQNFVPVIDDRGMFIGIVTRKAILQYFMGRYYPHDTAKQSKA